MKKWRYTCLIALIFISSLAFASPMNNTSFPKEIRDLIQKEEALDGFVMLTADKDTLLGIPKDLSLVVLSKGECCVLYIARETDAGWITESYSRKSLYPTKTQNEKVKIRKIDSQRFELSWPGETYSFYAGGTDHYSWLYQAVFNTDRGECVAQREENGTSIRFNCGNDTVTWNLNAYNQQTWLNYNPVLFPKSIKAVKQSNRVLTLFPESIYWGNSISIKNLDKSTRLYNCPSKQSKEMDTSDLFRQHSFLYYGSVDEKWYLIGYQNGLENACLGYISKAMFKLSKREQNATSISLLNEQLIANDNTWLTLDPYFSQIWYRQILAGTRMIGLAGFDADYVYVEIELNKELVRGFVPIQALDIYTNP